MLKYECESRCFNYPVKCRECKETSDIYNPDPCFLDRNSDLVKQIKAEGIKEFVETVDKAFSGVGTCNYGYVHYKIHSLLKEKIGEQG